VSNIVKYLRGAQTVAARSSGKLNFVRGRLIFVWCLRDGTFLAPRIVRSLQDVWKMRGPLIYIIGVYRDCLYRAENVVLLFQLVSWSRYRPLFVACVILRKYLQTLMVCHHFFFYISGVFSVRYAQRTKEQFL
jgi:hypothetical protein